MGDDTMKKSKIHWLNLIVSIMFSLGVGALSSILTKDYYNTYSSIIKPTLSPPSIVFPIVWSILYILMGISSYIVYSSHSRSKYSALTIYVIQLVFNGLWSIVFFNMHRYLLSFIVLITLWILILSMVYRFKQIDRLSGILQIPYLLWVTYAGYLNFSIYILNR